MRFPARVFLRCFSSVIVFALLLPIFTVSVFATEPSTFAQPNVEANVSQDQHTLVQSIFLELLLALHCQLTGIDLSNPTQSCLGINTQTHKLGYAPTDTQAGQLPIGGALGMLNQSIGTLYTPTFGSGDYTRYLSNNFGVVKTAVAATPYSGFDGLSMVLELWKSTRDIAYLLLVVAFIFIGIGVMLRLHIDPRTVMTIQNQIPRVIICIILITFSYAFAGALIDVMWAATYMGINKLTERTNPSLNCNGEAALKLDYYATQNILENPLTFANKIFLNECGGDDNSGIAQMSKDVANSISGLEVGVFTNVLQMDDDVTCGIQNFAECPQAALFSSVRWGLSVVWSLAVIITIFIALFRIWFTLLKAYVMVLLYVILAPVWIAFGLLPKRPLGFEKWLRGYFANLAVFPAVVLMLVAARVFHDLFNAAATASLPPELIPSFISSADAYRFVPPLIGNPDKANVGGFGVVIEVGFILIAPTTLDTLKRKLSVETFKEGAAAMATFTAGRSAAGAPAKAIKNHEWKRDQAGNAIGAGAALQDRIVGSVMNSRIGKKIPILSNAYDKAEYRKSNPYGSVGGYQKGHQYKDDFDIARRAAYARAEHRNTENPNEGKDFDAKWKDKKDKTGKKFNLEGWGQEQERIEAQQGARQPQQGRPAATQQGAPGQPQPGTAPAGGDATAGTVRGEINLTLRMPDGREEPIKIGDQQQSTRDVVLKNIPGTAKNATLRNEVKTAPALYWNEPFANLTQSQFARDGVQGMLDRIDWDEPPPTEEA